MKYNFGYGAALALLPVTLLAMLAMMFTGCENTPMRETAFFYGGYKAAAEAIEHHEGNRDAVQTVIAAIDILQGEQTILYTAVETWWQDTKPQLDLPPLELELLEQLFVVPLWQKIKAKYGGKVLDLQNEQVLADLQAFQRGLKMALYA